MPLEYPTGTIAEHLACRREAVVFDVSHLGTVHLDGDDASDRLQAVLTNDLAKIGPGRAQYTHLLDDADASVLDDLIVWWRPDGSFDVMPNASNTERVRAAIGGFDTTGGGRCWPCRALPPLSGWRQPCQASPPCAGSASSRWTGDRRRCWWPEPATRARRGWRSPSPPKPRPPCGTPSSVPASPRPGRRARHVAARSRAPVARPRAGTGDHPAAGRPRVGRRLGQADVPGPRCARGGAGAGRGPDARRCGHAGATATTRRVRRAPRRRRRRRHDQRQLLTGARPRHRPRSRATRPARRRRRGDRRARHPPPRLDRPHPVRPSS